MLIDSLAQSRSGCVGLNLISCHLCVRQPKTMTVNGIPRIAPASLWTRPKVQEFIQHVKSDPRSVLVVGRGETMTVRVPTHEGGKFNPLHPKVKPWAIQRFLTFESM